MLFLLLLILSAGSAFVVPFSGWAVFVSGNSQVCNKKSMSSNFSSHAHYWYDEATLFKTLCFQGVLRVLYQADRIWSQAEALFVRRRFGLQQQMSTSNVWELDACT